MVALNPSSRFLEGIKRKYDEGKAILEEELDGIPLLSEVPAARIAEQRDKMVIRPDDVFIATYQKSGTTWMQQIVKLIVNNGVDNDVHTDVLIPWHEHMTLEEIESMPSPRYFKSHLQYKLMPGGGDPEKTKAKYICVMRNPKDLAVSLYHHAKVMMPPHMVPPWDIFFNAFLGETIANGSFHSHYLGWWAHKDASNILILTFEKMKRDPRSAIISVADFLGYNLSDEVIDKIVVGSSFDKMKDNKTANKKYAENLMLGQGNFMNKGIIGNWKSVLTAQQSARIDALVEEKFAGSGIVFDFGE